VPVVVSTKKRPTFRAEESGVDESKNPGIVVLSAVGRPNYCLSVTDPVTVLRYNAGETGRTRASTRARP
jgi:hypothetical protein